MKINRLFNAVTGKPRGWVFITFLILFSASCSISYAQTISAGGKMGIMTGSMMTSANNMSIIAGGTLDNQGTLILNKNLINENTTPNSLGSGTLELSGTAVQSVSGQNIIQNLIANNYISFKFLDPFQK